MGIKIIDETYVTMKPDRCKIIDVFISEPGECVNICIPGDRIIRVSSNGLVEFFDETETLVKEEQF